MSFAFVVIIFYQLVLTTTPFHDYIFYAPRTDFVSGNREGLLSLIGYFSLLLFGIGLGRFLFFEMIDPQLLSELMDNQSKPVEIQTPCTQAKQE